MLTRRRLLLGLVGPNSGPVIDTHTHFYDPSRPLGVPWPPKTDETLFRTMFPDEFQKLTRPFNVVGTVVVEASPLFEDNQWILDLARHYPIICGFVGRLDPNSTEFAGQLVKLKSNRLFRGIRLGESAIKQGLKSKTFIENLKLLADQGMTLDAIGNSTMFPVVLKLTDRLPKLKVSLNHLPLDGELAALTELGKRPRVYAKVSGASPKTEQLDLLWSIFGTKRLLYGSNWPVSSKQAPYAQVFITVREYFERKGSAASRNFFYRNSADCYQWIKRR
jgi:L-fuconolactonase